MYFLFLLPTGRFDKGIWSNDEHSWIRSSLPQALFGCWLLVNERMRMERTNERAVRSIRRSTRHRLCLDHRPKRYRDGPRLLCFVACVFVCLLAVFSVFGWFLCFGWFVFVCCGLPTPLLFVLPLFGSQRYIHVCLLSTTHHTPCVCCTCCCSPSSAF